MKTLSNKTHEKNRKNAFKMKKRINEIVGKITFDERLAKE